MGIQHCDCRVSGDNVNNKQWQHELTSSFLSPSVGMDKSSTLPSSAHTGSVNIVKVTNADVLPMNARRLFVASSAVWMPLLVDEDAIEKAVASRANKRTAPTRNRTRELMMQMSWWSDVIRVGGVSIVRDQWNINNEQRRLDLDITDACTELWGMLNF